MLIQALRAIFESRVASLAEILEFLKPSQIVSDATTLAAIAAAFTAALLARTVDASPICAYHFVFTAKMTGFFVTACAFLTKP